MFLTGMKRSRFDLNLKDPLTTFYSPNEKLEGDAEVDTLVMPAQFEMGGSCQVTVKKTSQSASGFEDLTLQQDATTSSFTFDAGVPAVRINKDSAIVDGEEFEATDGFITFNNPEGTQITLTKTLQQGSTFVSPSYLNSVTVTTDADDLSITELHQFQFNRDTITEVSSVEYIDDVYRFYNLSESLNNLSDTTASFTSNYSTGLQLNASSNFLL